MFCQECGSENTDAAKFCVKCGSAIAAASYPSSLPTPPVLSPLDQSLPLAGNTSGTRGPVPKDVAKMGWCWGAFGLHFFWAAANRVWWVLPVMIICVIGVAASVLVNILSFVLLIILGLKGHEMAWRARKFDSLEQFQDTMKVWRTWGIAMVIFNVLFVVVSAMR